MNVLLSLRSLVRLTEFRRVIYVTRAEVQSENVSRGAAEFEIKLRTTSACFVTLEHSKAVAGNIIALVGALGDAGNHYMNDQLIMILTEKLWLVTMDC